MQLGATGTRVPVVEALSKKESSGAVAALVGTAVAVLPLAAGGTGYVVPVLQSVPMIRVTWL